MGRSVVYVCTGSDCRKDQRHAALLDAVEDVADVKRVGCQKVCKGPVAGTRVDGRVEWFARVRRKARGALAAWLDERDQQAPLPGELRERRVAKRAGHVR